MRGSESSVIMFLVCIGLCWSTTRWLMWTLVVINDMLDGEKEAYSLCLIRMSDEVVGG